MDEFDTSFLDGATTTQGISHALDSRSQALDSRTQTHARVINGLTEDDACEAASDVLEEFLAEMSAAGNVALPSLSGQTYLNVDNYKRDLRRLLEQATTMRIASDVPLQGTSANPGTGARMFEPRKGGAQVSCDQVPPSKPEHVTVPPMPPFVQSTLWKLSDISCGSRQHS